MPKTTTEPKLSFLLSYCAFFGDAKFTRQNSFQLTFSLMVSLFYKHSCVAFAAVEIILGVDHKT